MLERIILGIALAAGNANAASNDLQLNCNILNQTPACVEDTYHAHYDSDNGSISDGYDANDVKQGVSTDDNFVQMYSIDTGYVLTEDYRVFDPADSNSSVIYPIELVATDYMWIGLTGTNRLTVDKSAVDSIPSDFDVWLFRYDRNDNFIQSYDLRDANDYTDPNNNYIEWEVSEALGKYGALDLVYDEMSVADLNRDGYVNFIDYSIFANDWMETGAGLDGDLDSDNDCDTYDLGIFAENWLWYIRE